jgi:hypothetical protein
VSEDKVLCEICGKDITLYNAPRRMQHVNRCCDEAQKKGSTSKDMYPLEGAMDTKRTQLADVVTAGVYFCRICGKELTKALTKYRISHLKHCTKKYQASITVITQCII